MVNLTYDQRYRIKKHVTKDVRVMKLAAKTVGMRVDTDHRFFVAWVCTEIDAFLSENAKILVLGDEVKR